MVHHLRQLMRQPCTEITGLTRLLSSPNGKLDDLARDITTVTATALDGGSACQDSDRNTCDMGFPVMNRPHAVSQLLAKWPSTITEEYVLIAETDHLFMSAPPNRASKSTPACFPFGYMNANAAELRPIVARFVDDPETVDPCGPSPVLIHVDMLRKLTPEWLSLSFKLKRDAEANKIFGWVLEMWGYTMASNRLGIKHLVWDNFQTEPSALWHTSLDGNPHIYHYTFGLEFTTDGLPVATVGDWSMDKRHYMNAYPPRQLEPPPACAGNAAVTLHALFNEATANITDWPTPPFSAATPGAVKGTRGWGDGGVGGGVLSRTSKGGGMLTDAAYRRSSLAQAAATRGPWKWNGNGPVLFFRGGRLHTPWGSGRWFLAGDAIAVNLRTCGTYRLTFNKARTAFAVSVGHGPATSHGVLDGTKESEIKEGKEGEGGDVKDGEGEGKDDDDDVGEAEAEAVAARWRRMSDAKIYKRLVGSGPWAWQGVSPLAFLGGGVLHTPWGAGTWEVDTTHESTVRATFVGKTHRVTFDECWAFKSTREDDGDQASGTAKIDTPVDAPGRQCPKL